VFRFLALLALLAGMAHAAPFTPARDADVVEKLPSASDPALRTVESLRRQLAAQPGNATLRLDIAQRYFDLAMAQGDPRYVGYASATLAPLQAANAMDARYWLLRGLVQQYQHDFSAALASLAKASELDPKAVDPVAWRAAIHMVQARYGEAAKACERVAALADALYALGCRAYARAQSGQLAAAYDELSRALAGARDVPPALALWQRTRLAEWAQRLQRPDEAERHLRAALALGITDQYLLGAYADFLIQRGRPKEAVELLAGWERSDILLLRLALAGRASQDAKSQAWVAQMRERLADAARRGDSLHEQEAARFALDVENDPVAALALAKSNYAKQKEPRDAAILMRAALAAKQPQAAQPAVTWMRESGHEDPDLAKLAGMLR
jgi:Tfp pilus assembly protein PilF